MLILKNDFQIPCFEEQFLPHYENQYAAGCVPYLNKRYPFEKLSGEFMTIKEFNTCHPSQDFVHYRQEFMTASREEWNQLKQSIKAALTLISDESERIQIIYAFKKFEEHPTDLNKVLNQQHDTFKESKER